MDKVLWGFLACEQLSTLRPSEEEKKQIKSTLLAVVEGKRAWIVVPFNQYPGIFVIDSGRFALLYRRQSKNDGIFVVGVELCGEVG